MRVPFPAWLALASLVLACGKTLPGPAPRTDDQVTQAEAGDFCDAFAIIEKKCVRCHSDPPQHGAPFALDSYDATQIPIRDGKAIRADRMREVIDTGYMPLVSLKLDPPVQALSCEEKATILHWIDEGAEPPPDDDPDCDVAKPRVRSCDAAP